MAAEKESLAQTQDLTELTWNAILRWTDDHKVEWHYIAPGKPVQNAFRVLHRSLARRAAQ
jgi:hypothetical protein